MKSAAPALTLCSLLLAAALVTAGGVSLARRTETDRIPADRKGLLALAEALQKELRRLDDVYERDLRELVAALDPAGTIQNQQLIRGVHGVRACSILRRRPADEALVVRSSAADSTSPGVSLKPSPSRQFVTAAESRIFDDPAADGWDVVDPRPPFDFFVLRLTPKTAVALTIDHGELEPVTRAHLTGWLGRRLDPARAAGEIARIESPLGQAVAQTAPLPGERADFMIPLASRLGSWNLLSWDRRITTHSFHAPTLAASCTLGAVLALAGLILARAQHRTQRMAEQRVSFVNRVSHELGTPLTNMLLNLDLAREMIDAAPDEAARRLALVEDETRRLARLTANVLTFSRGERGSLTLRTRRCRPDEILTTVLDHFGPALARRAIAVETDLNVPRAVMIDPDALAQIASNLISNIEKYASAGGWAGIASRLENGNLVVEISDRGPGIPAPARERIFRPFERLHDEINEGSSGTGLGLSIARDLAQRMAGSLALEPSESGCRFRLTVPAPDVVDAAAPAPDPTGVLPLASSHPKEAGA